VAEATEKKPASMEDTLLAPHVPLFRLPKSMYMMLETIEELTVVEEKASDSEHEISDVEEPEVEDEMDKLFN